MKTKVRKTINLLLRGLIVVVTVWFVFDQILHRRDLTPLQYAVRDAVDEKAFYPVLALLLFLMVVNLSIETLKWKKLIDKLETVKFNRAFTAVLTGISVSMFTPNRVGDYLGRVFVLRETSHIKGILVTIIGSFAQLLSTLIAGGIALMFFLPAYHDALLTDYSWIYTGTVVIASGTILVALLLYFHVPVLKAVAGLLFPKHLEKVSSYAAVFSLYSKRELLRVLLLSMARYLVFSFQYYLLLRLFHVDLGYLPSMMLIALTYLILTMIPTMALIELGVRGSVSYYLFSLYLSANGLWVDGYSISVLAASTSLWLINLAFPALMGTFFVYRLKFIRRRDYGD